jgi:hypothetical protein
MRRESCTETSPSLLDGHLDKSRKDRRHICSVQSLKTSFSYGFVEVNLKGREDNVLIAYI